MEAELKDGEEEWTGGFQEGQRSGTIVEHIWTRGLRPPGEADQTNAITDRI